MLLAEPSRSDGHSEGRTPSGNTVANVRRLTPRCPGTCCTSLFLQTRRQVSARLAPPPCPPVFWTVPRATCCGLGLPYTPSGMSGESSLMPVEPPGVPAGCLMRGSQSGNPVWKVGSLLLYIPLCVLFFPRTSPIKYLKKKNSILVLEKSRSVTFRRTVTAGRVPESSLLCLVGQ